MGAHRASASGNGQRARERQSAFVFESEAASSLCERSSAVPRDAILTMPVGSRLFAITAGLYSFADLIAPMLDVVGVADLIVASWTCGTEEAALLGRLVKAGRLRSVTFIVDRSWPTRKVAFCQALVSGIGEESIRLGRCHAKVLVAVGDNGVMVAHGSLNMNPNLRCETVCIERDTDVARFNAEQWRDIAESLPSGLNVDNDKIRALFATFGVSEKTFDVLTLDGWDGGADVCFD